jgi:hypothetical protein
MVRTSLREIIRCLDEQKQLNAKLLDDGLESPDVRSRLPRAGCGKADVMEICALIWTKNFC